MSWGLAFLRISAIWPAPRRYRARAAATADFPFTAWRADLFAIAARRDEQQAIPFVTLWLQNKENLQGNELMWLFNSSRREAGFEILIACRLN
jgi:hypothetical protein